MEKEKKSEYLEDFSLKLLYISPEGSISLVQESHIRFLHLCTHPPVTKRMKSFKCKQKKGEEEKKVKEATPSNIRFI